MASSPGAPASPQGTPARSKPGPQLVPRKRPTLPHNLRMLLIAFGLLAISGGYVAVKRAGHRAVATAPTETARSTRGDLRRSLRLSGAITAKEVATIVAPRAAR